MKLTEKNSKVSGTFSWQDMKPPVNGTLNLEKQVNPHYKYSTESKASIFADDGSIEHRR